jgi:serralysin
MRPPRSSRFPRASAFVVAFACTVLADGVPAATPGLCLDGQRYSNTLASEFRGDGSWQHSRGGPWSTQFPWGRTNPTGGDAAYYADPGLVPGYDPFGIGGGDTLEITARRLPESLRHNAAGEFVSGVIATAQPAGEPAFAQRFGYYELRARLPLGRGLWPAFWMRDAHGGPAEIDVFELLGDDTTTLYETAHYADGAAAQYRYHPAFDPTLGFHDYGVLLTSKSDTFYVDGHATHAVADASTGAMYVIVSMQVGAPGSWPGPPDSTTPWPATLSVKSFRAYAPTGEACP